MAARAELARPIHGARIRYGELLVKGLLGLCALVSVATTLGIILALFLPAIEFFQDVSIVAFLTGTEWAPLFEPALFGVLPLVVGTLSVTFWAVLVAIPLGLLIANFSLVRRGIGPIVSPRWVSHSGAVMKVAPMASVAP